MSVELGRNDMQRMAVTPQWQWWKILWLVQENTMHWTRRASLVHVMRRGVHDLPLAVEDKTEEERLSESIVVVDNCGSDDLLTADKTSMFARNDRKGGGYIIMRALDENAAVAQLQKNKPSRILDLGRVSLISRQQRRRWQWQRFGNDRTSVDILINFLRLFTKTLGLHCSALVVCVVLSRSRNVFARHYNALGQSETCLRHRYQQCCRIAHYPPRSSTGDRDRSPGQRYMLATREPGDGGRTRRCHATGPIPAARESCRRSVLRRMRDVVNLYSAHDLR